jgi:hypothetical protein
MTPEMRVMGSLGLTVIGYRERKGIARNISIREAA